MPAHIALHHTHTHARARARAHTHTHTHIATAHHPGRLAVSLPVKQSIQLQFNGCRFSHMTLWYESSKSRFVCTESYRGPPRRKRYQRSWPPLKTKQTKTTLQRSVFLILIWLACSHLPHIRSHCKSFGDAMPLYNSMVVPVLHFS